MKSQKRFRKDGLDRKRLRWVWTFICGILALVFSFQVLLARTSGEAKIYSNQPEVTPDLLLLQSLSEKVALADRYQASRAAGVRDPAPRIAIQAEPDLEKASDPAFREGIITGEPGPFYAQEFTVENLWQISVADGYIQVYAGALGEDPEQGVVVVLATASNRIGGTETWVFAPTRSGGLRILSAEAGVLSLQSLQGEQLFFDWAEARFVDAP